MLPRLRSLGQGGESLNGSVNSIGADVRKFQEMGVIQLGVAHSVQKMTARLAQPQRNINNRILSLACCL